MRVVGLSWDGNALWAGFMVRRGHLATPRGAVLAPRNEGTAGFAVAQEGSQ